LIIATAVPIVASSLALMTLSAIHEKTVAKAIQDI
jgi:hypothetical protein